MEDSVLQQKLQEYSDSVWKEYAHSWKSIIGSEIIPVTSPSPHYVTIQQSGQISKTLLLSENQIIWQNHFMIALTEMYVQFETYLYSTLYRYLKNKYTLEECPFNDESYRFGKVYLAHQRQDHNGKPMRLYDSRVICVSKDTASLFELSNGDRYIKMPILYKGIVNENRLQELSFWCMIASRRNYEWLRCYFITQDHPVMAITDDPMMTYLNYVLQLEVALEVVNDKGIYVPCQEMNMIANTYIQKQISLKAIMENK
jgi:hypothetical protein